jgi:predicted phage-related endonuclease
MRSRPSPMEVLLPDLLLFPPATAANDADLVGQVAPSSSAGFGWPRLGGLQLSAERLDARSRGIGGSDANVILSGDTERVHRLWQEKRGEAEPEDLSDRLAVVLGCWTEEFNRQWYTKLSGNLVTDAGAQLTCSDFRWRKCTLDGVVAGSGAIFEAKHTNSFVKPEDVLERYMPQLQHNMAVAKADRAVLSVIFGNARYEMFEIAADWLYQLDLLEAEKAFWSAVLSGEPPVVVDAPPAPRPVATRELSFEGNNAWASAAADWLQTNQAAKTHASACKTIKELLEDDVRRALGHGIEARRNKAGAITIREAP